MCDVVSKLYCIIYLGNILQMCDVVVWLSIKVVYIIYLGNILQMCDVVSKLYCNVYLLGIFSDFWIQHQVQNDKLSGYPREVKAIHSVFSISLHNCIKLCPVYLFLQLPMTFQRRCRKSRCRCDSYHWYQGKKSSNSHVSTSTIFEASTTTSINLGSSQVIYPDWEMTRHQL